MKTNRETPERPVDEKALVAALNGDSELKTSKNPEDAMQWLRDVYGISVASLQAQFGIQGKPNLNDSDLLRVDGNEQTGIIRVKIPGLDLTGKATEYPLVRFNRVGDSRYQWSVPMGGSEVLFARPDEVDEIGCMRLEDVRKNQARVIENLVDGGHAAV